MYKITPIAVSYFGMELHTCKPCDAVAVSFLAKYDCEDLCLPFVYPIL